MKKRASIDGTTKLTINPKHHRRVDLSISLLSYNTKDLLENCLKAIITNTKKINYEILLVDNGSIDNTSKMVRKKFPDVKLTSNKQNRLFIKAHNQNLKRVKGRYFLILNEDTGIGPNVLEKMVKFMDNNPKVGLASCRQVDEFGKVDMTCSKYPPPLAELFESSLLVRAVKRLIPLPLVNKLLTDYRYSHWRRNTIKEVDVLPGSFFIGKRELLEKIGLLDEKLLFFYGEPDYCQRAKNAGFLTFHNGNVTIKHLRSKAFAKLPAFRRYQISEHDMLVYYKKYFGWFWWLLLWILFRPNWLYWRLNQILSTQHQSISKN